MGRSCDVCGAEVATDQRYCPACGLELVEPENQLGGSAAAIPKRGQRKSDRATKDEEAGPRDYVLRDAGPDVALAREKLQRAQQLLAEGRLRQCTELLQAVRDQLGSDPKGRQLFQRTARGLKQAKTQVIQQGEVLLDDPRRLHRYLTGPAAEQLEREEICRLALRAVQSRYQQDAESVHALLRLPVFRQTSDKQIRSEHHRLEQLVWRRARRQHFFTSTAVFAAVIAIAVPALFIWIWFLMQLPFAVKLFISALALLMLVWGMNPLRKWIERMVEGEEDDEDED